jgi:putative inorganic carbon (hco3(-)) transporter
MKLVLQEIKAFYGSSLTKRVILFLFEDDYCLRFGDTYIGKILTKYSFQNIGVFLFYLSIIFLWFRGLLVQFFPFFESGLIIPLTLLASFLLLDKQNVQIKKIHLWYLAFLLVASISGLWAILNGLRVEMIVMGLMIYFQFGLAFFVGGSLGESLVVFAKRIILISIPLIFYSAYQYIAKVETPAVWVNVAENITTRSYGFFGSPNILGAVVTILILLSLFAYKKSRYIYYLFFLPLGAFVLYATFSRMAWSAILVSFVVMAFLGYKRLFYIGVILSPLVFLLENVRSRILIIFSPSYINDATLDGRIWSGINAFYLFSKNLLLGTGPGTYGGQIALSYASPVYLQGIQEGYTALYYTDNQFFQVLVQTGILGTATLTLFFICLIVLFARQIKSNKDSATLGLMVLAGFLWMGLFSNIMEFSAVVVPAIALLGVISVEK